MRTKGPADLKHRAGSVHPVLPIGIPLWGTSGGVLQRALKAFRSELTTLNPGSVVHLSSQVNSVETPKCPYLTRRIPGSRVRERWVPDDGRGLSSPRQRSRRLAWEQSNVGGWP